MKRAIIPTIASALTALAPLFEAQVVHQDTARLAVQYSVLKHDNPEGETFKEEALEQPVVIVTTRHYVPLSSVESGDAFTLVDAEEGTPVSDVRGFSRLVGAEQDFTYTPPGGSATTEKMRTWFMLGGSIDPEREYTLTIHYDEILAKDFDLLALALVDPDEPPQEVTLQVDRLERGRKVTELGNTEALGKGDMDPTGTESGLSALFPDTDLKLTPEIGEGSSEFGLSYELRNYVRRSNSGSGWRYTVDIDAHGRFSSEEGSSSLAGYGKGDLSFRWMKLLRLTDNERYHPLGIRAALGYESNDDFDETRFTATAQVVASVPYVDEALLWWHGLVDVNRPFAPPFVSASYVHSDGMDAMIPDQSRVEFEAGWIAPVAERWDLDLSYRYFDFSESGMMDEELTEASLIYFPGEDRSSGIRFGLEEGFRPMVGDIGHTLLVGYEFKGF